MRLFLDIARKLAITAFEDGALSRGRLGGRRRSSNESNAELRAVAEDHAADDGRDRFVADFGQAWSNVKTLERF